jgi:predicted ATP-grasp superfamily ATP-dependent carboligase
MIELDASVPALLVRIGRYPIHAGSLGVVRSLGSLGVPVYALVEHRLTPLARSRHLAGAFAWCGDDGPDDLVQQLCAIGRTLGRRAVAVATDDDAAVLLAEHADRLRPYLVLPPVVPDLPRRLAAKRHLYDLCLAHGVPTPRTLCPSSAADLDACGDELGYPLVAKNAFAAGARAAVPGTTLVRDRRELRERFARLPDVSSLLLQEYIPFEGDNDWFVHAYCDTGAQPAVSFVGRKAYAWPPARGITADARSAANAELRELSAGFCKALRYSGVNDLDWRYDRRDRRYKLVDFNPRVGAQFRFGLTTDGVDVVRALHLDLTGRPAAAGDQDHRRRLVVENVHLAARLGHRRAGMPAPPAVPAGTRTTGAWREGSARDPVPLIVMTATVAVRAVRGLVRLFLHRGPAHRTATRTGPDARQLEDR